MGHLSGMVRDRLWDKCCKRLKDKGGMVQAWATNNEQRFQMRTWGTTKRQVVDLDGLQLIRLPIPPSKKPPEGLSPHAWG